MINIRDTNEMTRRMLIAQATEDHKEYPQYKGYFDNHQLYRVKKNIKTKMGMAFKKNELAIGIDTGRIIDGGPYVGKRSLTLYSVANGVNTGLPEHFVEKVA